MQAAFPHPGQGRVAALIRRLTAGSRPARARPRVQDSYAFRALPQVHGTALDAAARLDAELAVALNAAAENPLAGDRMLHNGNFHTAALTAAADGACAALTQAAALSAARLAALMDPAVTGLHAFLAERADDSSGALILEYVAHAALAELRGQPAPRRPPRPVGALAGHRGARELRHAVRAPARRRGRVGDRGRGVRTGRRRPGAAAPRRSAPAGAGRLDARRSNGRPWPAEMADRSLRAA